jgi:DNA-binding response OmpR family regulator
MRVLIVEDELNLARGLIFNLQRIDIEAEHVSSGEEALQRFSEFDLMVLDLGLPGIDGFEVLKQLRRHDERYPVIVLTARASEDDRIQGLALGADDYVIKPFSLQELLLRIQGKLKRSRWYRHDGAEHAQIGAANIDFSQNRARRNDEEIVLTEREAALCRFLLANPDRVISREELLTEVWGYAEGTSSRTVDTFIARLRKLVEPDVSTPCYIVSVRGTGYMYKAEGDTLVTGK